VSGRHLITILLTVVIFIAEVIVGLIIGAVVVHLLHPSYGSSDDGYTLGQAMRGYWPATIVVLMGCVAMAVKLARRFGPRRG
jgi:hypothetical protein